MESEYLAILDENGIETGEQVSYEEAHEKGVLHRSVHVWFLNAQRDLLLQKRSAEMRAYPGRWDISVSGHVMYGESSIEGAQREVMEEIGLDLPEDAFEYLFTIREDVELNEGSYVAREFQDVYLVRADFAVEDLELDAHEVERLRWTDLRQLRNLIGSDEIVPHEEEYERLLVYFSEHGTDW